MREFFKLFISLMIMFIAFFAEISFAQFTPVQEQSLFSKEYILNGGFEGGTSKWRRYNDGAVSAPVDCIGGTPTITFSSTTTGPIQGKASGSYTKPGTNTQGQGISTDFILDKDARTKILTITGSYEISTGTYQGGTSATDSDLTLYVVDTVSGTVIQPAGFKLDGGVSGNTYSWNATFQTPHFTTDTRTMRLCIHSATASATAFSSLLDKVKIGVQNKSQGPPLTDVVSAGTMTLGSTATQPTKATTTVIDVVKYQRFGDSGHFVYEYKHTSATGAVAGSGDYLLSLPAGLSFDASKVDFYTGGDVHSFQGFGTFKISMNQSGSNFIGVGKIVPYDATRFRVMLVYNNFSGNVAYGGIWGQGNFTITNTPYAYSADFIAPISGWKSTVTMSDSGDYRLVAASLAASTPTGGLTTGMTPVTFPSISMDTHGSYVGSSYTVTVPGLYFVDANLNTVGTYAATTSNRIAIYKNGTELKGYQNNAQGAGGLLVDHINSVDFYKAGDVIQIYHQTNATSPSYRSNENWLSVFKLSGISQIAASESITAEYYSTTGQSVANNIMTYLDFGTRESDSHTAVLGAGTGPVTTSGTGWRYVCPLSGKYSVNATAGYAAPSVSNPGGSGTYIAIFVQGSQFHQGTRFDGISTGAAGHFQHTVSANVPCTAGQRIEIGLIQNAGGVTRTLSTSSNNVRVTINRVGNQ